MQSETWLPVPFSGFPYEVSNAGRIRRLSIASIHVRRIHPRRSYAPRILTPVVNNGYKYVTLSQGNRQKRVSVHALVLMVFKSKRPRGMYGCHKDGDKGNNLISNLKWATPKENQEDRVRHGRGQEGEQNGSVKLTDVQVRWIRRLRKDGVLYKTLAKVFKVSKGNIHLICTRQSRRSA